MARKPVTGRCCPNVECDFRGKTSAGNIILHSRDVHLIVAMRKSSPFSHLRDPHSTANRFADSLTIAA